MIDPWPTLRRAGLPLGSPDASAPRPRAAELGSAVEQAIAEQPSGRHRDALAALVLAWRRQWPRTFSSTFGPRAANVETWARGAVIDPNRYLKLARIATEHLATVL